jgi:hypothetical protein
MAADAVHDDLQHRLDVLGNTDPVQTLLQTSRYGSFMQAEYDLDSEPSSSTEWNKQFLRQALWKLEQVNRQGEIARVMCFQIIDAH